jgi:hypothetical protein
MASHIHKCQEKNWSDTAIQVQKCIRVTECAASW